MQRLDHGAIGNGRAIALVAPDSAIEWLCLPRFDSPSLFGALLDQERGGTFRILARDQPITGSAAYVQNTNILRTEFTSADGRWEIIDFMPRVGTGAGRVETPLEICRIVRPLAGAPRLRIQFDPRPDYGRRAGTLVATEYGVDVLGADGPVHLFTNMAGQQVLDQTEVTLGAPLFFLLSYGSRAQAPSVAELDHLYAETIASWRMWAKTTALPSFASAQVLRSALCLKLHAYVDTGAIIAAATTSIPEALGTERCWDYRYCWLRDAAFVVEALRRLSHLVEGEQFIGFLRTVAEAGPLQPLYGIGGERELPETTLPNLRGFRGTGPVRVGNAAALQQQNDLVGEIVFTLNTVLADPRLVIDRPAEYFPLVERLVDRAIEIAPLPDMGIWEFRTLPRHYTFSRAMCWAAIVRGAAIAKAFDRPALAERWTQIADAEREIILERGYSKELGCFTQALDGDTGDASCLLLPAIGVVDARDPRFQNTLDHYAATMTGDGLMKRYTNLDDFGPTTSAHTICTFWWAEALALAGRLDEAIEVFDRVTRHANPLGLYSEDIEPSTGELLGNFPQAYTHVGLIHAAITIGTLIDARDRRVRL